jgi:hypothetical protein
MRPFVCRTPVCFLLILAERCGDHGGGLLVFFIYIEGRVGVGFMSLCAPTLWAILGDILPLNFPGTRVLICVITRHKCVIWVRYEQGEYSVGRRSRRQENSYTRKRRRSYSAMTTFFALPARRSSYTAARNYARRYYADGSRSLLWCSKIMPATFTSLCPPIPPRSENSPAACGCCSTGLAPRIAVTTTSAPAFLNSSSSS